MAGESLRRARRRQRLEELLVQIGGATQAEIDTGTPRTHFVALMKGRRGLGDDLAAKLEKIYRKPPGWFDAGGQNYWPFSLELQEEVLHMAPEDVHRMEVAMWAHLRKDVPAQLHYPNEEEAGRARGKAPSTITEIGGSNAHLDLKKTS